MTTQPSIMELFHRCWGHCTDSPAYDKEAWKQLQRLLEAHKSESVSNAREEQIRADERGRVADSLLQLLVKSCCPASYIPTMRMFIASLAAAAQSKDSNDAHSVASLDAAPVAAGRSYMMRTDGKLYAPLPACTEQEADDGGAAFDRGYDGADLHEITLAARTTVAYLRQTWSERSAQDVDRTLAHVLGMLEDLDAPQVEWTEQGCARIGSVSLETTPYGVSGTVVEVIPDGEAIAARVLRRDESEARRIAVIVARELQREKDEAP